MKNRNEEYKSYTLDGVESSLVEIACHEFKNLSCQEFDLAEIKCKIKSENNLIVYEIHN